MFWISPLVNIFEDFNQDGEARITAVFVASVNDTMDAFRRRNSQKFIS